MVPTQKALRLPPCGNMSSGHGIFLKHALLGLALLIFLGVPSHGAGADRYRIGLTPVFLDNQA